MLTFPLYKESVFTNTNMLPIQLNQTYHLHSLKINYGLLELNYPSNIMFLHQGITPHLIKQANDIWLSYLLGSIHSLTQDLGPLHSHVYPIVSNLLDFYMLNSKVRACPSPILPHLHLDIILL